MFDEVDKLNTVQWECHLSGANASETIHNQILTIRHLVIGLASESELMTRILKHLPTPLVRGGLAWFRVSFKLTAGQSSELIIVEILCLE